MEISNWTLLNAVLDRLSFGVILLDHAGRPIFSNRRGEEIIRRKHAFHVDNAGRLRIAQKTADRQLIEIIETLYQEPAKAAPRSIPVRSDADGPLLCAWVSPLTETGDDPSCSNLPGRPVAAVMITETAARSISNEVLCNLFNLTRAEAKLLRSLLEGLSANEYAASRNLSQNTVRNQLKSIFEKTQVRRQSELVGLVFGLVAPLDFATTGPSETESASANSHLRERTAG